MRRLNETLRFSIVNSLELIKKESFDQTTIKLLLIDIRDYAPNKSLLKEICHFVAHSERTEGLFHKKILSRYKRIEYIQKVFKSLDLRNPPKGVIFEDLFFEKAGYGFYDKIPSRYFQIVFEDGLDDFDERFFLTVFNTDKEQIRSMILSHYRKNNGFYVIRSKEFMNVKKVMSILHTSIQFRPILNQKELIDQLKDALELIIKNENISKEYLLYLENYRDDIFVCIMSLLHDVTFIDDEEEIGNSYLSTNNSKLVLCCDFCPYGKKHTFILLSSEADTVNYIENKTMVYNNFDRIVQFSAKRNSNGLLVLN